MIVHERASADRVATLRSEPGQGLFSLAEIDDAALSRLVHRSVALSVDSQDHVRPLAERIIGLLFMRTSTRTRTAFTAAAVRLGGTPLAFGPADLQTNTGESIQDTGRVLGAMLDAIVIRTAGPVQEMRDLSCWGRVPVVNAMSAEEHPTQGICDLATMQLQFGALDGLSLLYIGEGNSTATALAHGLARMPGAQTTFVTPAGFGLPTQVALTASACARRHGGSLTELSSMAELPTDVDVVYTSRWQTTGSTKADAGWREAFRPFHVDDALMRRWPAAWFLHDLPAHRGEEVSGSVLDGPRSLAWTQATMKLSSAMAVLEQTLAES